MSNMIPNNHSHRNAALDGLCPAWQPVSRLQPFMTVFVGGLSPSTRFGGCGGVGGAIRRQFPIFPHPPVLCRRLSPCFPLPLPHGGSQHRISRSQKRQTSVFPPANANPARRLRLFPPPITADVPPIALRKVALDFDRQRHRFSAPQTQCRQPAFQASRL